MDSELKSIHERFLQERIIDLRQYWLAILRHKWWVLGFTLGVTLLCILTVLSMTPQYRATATLLIETEQPKVVSIEQVYGLESKNKEYFLTQFEILRSRNLDETVVRKYDLMNHPEFNRAPTFNWRAFLGTASSEKESAAITEGEALQHYVDQFIKRLTITPVHKTQLVNISFEASEPAFAAQMANALGEAYIENNLQAKLDVTEKAASWLDERLTGLKEKLRASERRLQEFRDSEQIIGARGGLDIAVNEMNMVANKLVEMRRQRLEAENIYREIRAIGARADAARFEAIPTVLAHPVVQRYKQALLRAEQKKSELSKRYGAKHPKMVAVTSEVNGTRRLLDHQITSVVSGIANQYRVAQSSERALAQSLWDIKQQIQGLMRKKYRLTELEQEVASNRKLYDTFYNRLNETVATYDLKTANARLVDKAVPPLKPAKPKKRTIVVLGFLGSLFLSIVAVILLEALRDTVHGRYEAWVKLGETTMGLLPRLPVTEQRQVYRHYLDENDSGFADAIRTMRTGLLLPSPDSSHKVIAITSTISGEGKTAVAMNLTYSLAQMERVLLIESDMRRNVIANLHGFDSDAPGLSNLISGTASLDECIYRLDNEGADVMPAGEISSDPTLLLSSDQFADILSDLATRYDRIVIDTAPCRDMSDALILSDKVDSMLYVVKAGVTPAAKAQMGLYRLSEVGAPMAGVVLNFSASDLI